VSSDADDFSELAGMIARSQESADRDAVKAVDPARIAARRRRQKRQRITAALVALAVAAGVGTYVPMTLLAPVGETMPMVTAPVVPIPAAVTVQLPGVGASAVSLSGAEHFAAGTVGADGILASSGGGEARPIASITKLITALVLLDAKPLSASDEGPTITFSKADAALYDKYYVQQATVYAMKAGSTMSQRDALEVMLIVSATNYAEAVTRWGFGSMPTFVDAARQWLQARGLAGTTIVEPTGLDPRNTSTPSDLIAIGKLAMADPVISEIVGSQALRIPDLQTAGNTNELIGVDGVNGIKTGTLDAAGACLLFSAAVDVGLSSPVSIIGVVLGGDNHYQVNNAVRALVSSIRSGFHEVPLVVKGQVLGSYTAPWGETAEIVAARDASVLTWSDQAVSADIVAEPIGIARKGAPAGRAIFTAGSESIDVRLVLDAGIEGPDGWWRLTHPAELLG
jgi:D-alanyl-D-alanine carboxypeptidase (penicillin-binding protein 5/6)